MSWSFSAEGNPDEVAQAITESSNNSLTDQSLAEWNDAWPALLALVSANKGNQLTVSASGHASFTNGEKTYGNCVCTIQAK